MTTFRINNSTSAEIHTHMTDERGLSFSKRKQFESDPCWREVRWRLLVGPVCRGVLLHVPRTSFRLREATFAWDSVRVLVERARASFDVLREAGTDPRDLVCGEQTPVLREQDSYNPPLEQCN